jgi:hypothetical protein
VVPVSADDGRGQVVLLAAVVVAVALVAMTTAYHGLGYRGDVRATAEIGDEDPVSTAERRLQQSVDAVAVGPVRPWDRRNVTVVDVREALANSTVEQQRAGTTRRTVFVVEEDARAASMWATEDCPRGPMRAFGPCRAIGGVVVQERANETVLVGVAIELTVRSPRSETTARLRLAAR